MRWSEYVTRRRFLATATLAAGGIGAVAASGATFAQELVPTPACRDGGAATPRQTEGPFYKPRSPERVDLIEAGTKGKIVELSGRVLTRACMPVAGALVDLWHADDRGEYDNRGTRYRGHQFTDAEGRYRFRTVIPAIYEGRARHYHVKVQAPGRPVLTTQLYFSDDPQNRRDALVRKELLLHIAPAGEGLSARFDFVLDMR